MWHPLYSLPCLALLAACAPPVTPQGTAPRGPHSGAFVTRMGVDTIAVERFARAGNVYTHEHAVRSRRPALYRTRIELTPAGDLSRASRAEHRIGAPAD